MIKYELRDRFKLCVKYVMRLLLKVYWIFPIKRNKVLFMANMGKGYLCNPKYIYESMLQDTRYSDYEFIWCFRDISGHESLLNNKNTFIVNKNNYFKYFYQLLTSGVIIYNCGGFSYAPIRKKQYLIETGHGGGLQKRNGFLVANKSSSSNKGIALASKDIKLWISSSKLQTEMYTRQAMAYAGEVLESGYPRTDLFFRATDEMKRNIRQRLGISKAKKVVLYAPTFKGDEGHAVALSEGIEVINVKTVKNELRQKFGGDWLFAKRGHQYSQEVGVDGTDYDWTKYPDMQEILLITDVLITDYSSCLWDFAIMKKPCFLYVPDLRTYRDADRGFYIPIEKWAGVVVHDNSEWTTKIEQFDQLEYINWVEKYLDMMGSFENGTATEQVKEKILTRN